MVMVRLITKNSLLRLFLLWNSIKIKKYEQAFKFFEDIAEDGKQRIIKIEHILSSEKQYGLKVNEDDIRKDVKVLEE